MGFENLKKKGIKFKTKQLVARVQSITRQKGTSTMPKNHWMRKDDANRRSSDLTDI